MKFMLVSEVSRELGVAASTVREMERDGRLKALRTSRGVRLFDASEIAKIAAQRKAQQSEKRE
jgi:excisionase family DNA binding protein